MFCAFLSFLLSLEIKFWMLFDLIQFIPITNITFAKIQDNSYFKIFNTHYQLTFKNPRGTEIPPF